MLVDVAENEVFEPLQILLVPVIVGAIGFALTVNVLACCAEHPLASVNVTT